MARLLKSKLFGWPIDRHEEADGIRAVREVENDRGCVYRVNCLPIRGRPRYRPLTAGAVYATGIATRGKNRIARRYFRPDHHRATIRRPLAPRKRVKDPLGTPGTKVMRARCVGKPAWHKF